MDTNTTNEDTNTVKDFLDYAIDDLKKKSNNLTYAGIAIFIITFLVAVWLFYDIKVTTDLHLEKLNKAVNSTNSPKLLVIKQEFFEYKTILFYDFVAKQINKKRIE